MKSLITRYFRGFTFRKHLACLVLKQVKDTFSQFLLSWMQTNLRNTHVYGLKILVNEIGALIDLPCHYRSCQCSNDCFQSACLQCGTFARGCGTRDVQWRGWIRLQFDVTKTWNIHAQYSNVHLSVLILYIDSVLGLCQCQLFATIVRYTQCVTLLSVIIIVLFWYGLVCVCSNC